MVDENKAAEAAKNEAAKPAKEPIADPRGVAPQMKVNREAPQLLFQLNTMDEILGYLLSLRDPGRITTSFPAVLVPNNIKLLDIENSMPNPRRVRKSPVFVDVNSFNKYFETFRHGYEPRIFAEKTDSGLTILSVFDYDNAGKEVKHTDKETGEVKAIGHDKPVPQWGDHYAKLELTFHPDYANLRANANKWFEQEEFALFVEENLHLFTKPDGSTMMEIAQELKGHRNAGWAFGSRLKNGQQTLQYSETIEAKTSQGDIVVPETLELRSPIFEGFEPKDFKAAFRFKLDEKKIKFNYRLMTKLEERQGQDDVIKKVEDVAKLDVLRVEGFDGIIKKAA